MNITVQTTAVDPAKAKAQCPRCGNKEAIRAAGATRQGRMHYDIYSDTCGVLRCSHCGHRAHRSDFVGDRPSR